MAEVRTMLDKVKLALQITTNVFDSDISENIAAARAEMIRNGIASTKANSDTDALVTKAIKTFCQKEYSDDDLAERYEQSWLYQLDNLRKSSDYRGGDSVEE